MSRSSNRRQFWITNISKRNVSLADLGFTIHKGRSYNLLDEKHFVYTPEQLAKSLASGSLHNKRHMVHVVAGPPQQVHQMIALAEQPIQVRKRSAVKVEEGEYEELAVSDEQFTEEFLNDYT